MTVSAAAPVLGPVSMSVTHLDPHTRAVASRKATIARPDDIYTEAGLRVFGEQIAAAMCARHRQPELTFVVPREHPLPTDEVVEQLFRWRPERTVGQLVADWKTSDLIAATVVNALCHAVPGWCEAIGRRSVRCEISTDGLLVTIAFSFKRPLHPHRLRPDLLS